MLRHQLPVRSPLGPKAIRAGLRALSGRAGALAARETIESTLRERFGIARVVLTDSGTSALRLAIAALDRGAGRPVAIPAYGCFDLATAVLGAGGPYVLYDVDPDTLGPVPASLRRALEGGADRVVIAHLYGVPVDLSVVEPLTASFGASVIDDAAQGAGASFAGRPLGAFGRAGVLSFGRGKGVTGGGGGALLLGDEATAHRLALGPNADGAAGGLVKLVAQWLLGRPLLYGIPSALPFLGLGETKFRAPHQPTEPSDLSMGVLTESLRVIDEDTGIRRANAARLAAAMRGDALVAPRVPESAIAGFLRFPVVASPVKAREAARNDARRLGIMPGYPTALCDLAGFGEGRANPDEGCAGARTLAERLITLPTHAALEARDLDRLAAWCGR